MNDFEVSAVQAAIREAIERAEVMRLSRAHLLCFADVLLAPPPSNPALARAFERRRKLLSWSDSLIAVVPPRQPS